MKHRNNRTADTIWVFTCFVAGVTAVLLYNADILGWN